MKDRNTVIEEFNELVNMKASELESWLKSDDSQSAGWPKEGEDGESVGHESGGKIVAILKSNPGKDAEKYTDDQVQHMRKVVAYCKRHLAQEEKGNSEKSTEEVKKTKSFASLKNWGHDVLKKKNDKNGTSKKRDNENGVKQAKEDENKEEGKQDNDNDDDGKKAGDKRKAPNDNIQTRAKKGGAKSKSSDEDNDEDGHEEDEADDVENSGKAAKGPNVGETVSWNWGGGKPKGKVLDVKDEPTTITTKRGNQVSRKG